MRPAGVVREVGGDAPDKLGKQKTYQLDATRHTGPPHAGHFFVAISLASYIVAPPPPG